jgi:hypothetical protein
MGGIDDALKIGHCGYMLDSTLKLATADAASILGIPQLNRDLQVKNVFRVHGNNF